MPVPSEKEPEKKPLTYQELKKKYRFLGNRRLQEILLRRRQREARRRRSIRCFEAAFRRRVDQADRKQRPRLASILSRIPVPQLRRTFVTALRDALRLERRRLGRHVPKTQPLQRESTRCTRST